MKIKLPLCPSNYPFYYRQLIRQAEEHKTARQKINFTNKVMRELATLVKQSYPYQSNLLANNLYKWFKDQHLASTKKLKNTNLSDNLRKQLKKMNDKDYDYVFIHNHSLLPVTLSDLTNELKHLDKQDSALIL